MSEETEDLSESIESKSIEVEDYVEDDLVIECYPELIPQQVAEAVITMLARLGIEANTSVYIEGSYDSDQADNGLELIQIPVGDDMLVNICGGHRGRIISVIINRPEKPYISSQTLVKNIRKTMRHRQRIIKLGYTSSRDPSQDEDRNIPLGYYKEIDTTSPFKVIFELKDLLAALDIYDLETDSCKIHGKALKK